MDIEEIIKTTVKDMDKNDAAALLRDIANEINAPPEERIIAGVKFGFFKTDGEPFLIEDRSDDYSSWFIFNEDDIKDIVAFWRECGADV